MWKKCMAPPCGFRVEKSYSHERELLHQPGYLIINVFKLVKKASLPSLSQD